jgi:hypothetical protein
MIAIADSPPAVDSNQTAEIAPAPVPDPQPIESPIVKPVIIGATEVVTEKKRGWWKR